MGQPLKAYAQVMITNTELDGYWTDPEFFRGKTITPKSDVYAFGFILWEMYTKQIPFQGLSFNQLIKQVRRGQKPEIPASIPEFMRDLISSCWESKPSKRPNFTEIKKHLLEDGLTNLVEM